MPVGNDTLKKISRKPSPHALRNHLGMKDGNVACQKRILPDN
jgi:hypothetical protein